MLVDAQPPSAISYLLPPALRISINPCLNAYGTQIAKLAHSNSC